MDPGARRPYEPLLTELLEYVVKHPTDVNGWRKLLLFPRVVLARPAGLEQSGNLSNVISRQCASFQNGATMSPVLATNRFFHQPNHRRGGADAEMVRVAREVSVKLEEGNYRGAVRRLCSNDCIAPNTSDTIQALKLKHPRLLVGENCDTTGPRSARTTGRARSGEIGYF